MTQTKKSSRKAPQRTCVACRAVKDKRELTRIVREPDGKVAIDPRGKLAGRGAYICSNPVAGRPACPATGWILC